LLRKHKLRAAAKSVAAILLTYLAPAWAAPVINKPAPSLIVETATGGEVDLAALRGKVVLINFWATWCAPCLEEFPAMGKFYRDHQKEGLEVIALSIDRPRDREKIRRLIAALPFKAALLSDASRNGFGTPEAVPESWLIDARGVVRDHFISLDEQLLDEAVLPVLREARGDMR
jgi:cytochrome c biogenesis protein CcmG/thiol:disulfide interchange protein DsbE